MYQFLHLAPAFSLFLLTVAMEKDNALHTLRFAAILLICVVFLLDPMYCLKIKPQSSMYNPASIRLGLTCIEHPPIFQRLFIACIIFSLVTLAFKFNVCRKLDLAYF